MTQQLGIIQMQVNRSDIVPNLSQSQAQKEDPPPLTALQFVILVNSLHTLNKKPCHPFTLVTQNGVLSDLTTARGRSTFKSYGAAKLGVRAQNASRPRLLSTNYKTIK